MEAKKSKEANLETKRMAFFSIGLLMVSSVIYASFAFVQGEADEKHEQIVKNTFNDEFMEELPPEQEPPPPEEQQQAPPPPVIEDIAVQEDDVVVDDLDLDFDDEPELPPPPKEEKIEKEEVFDFAEVEPTFPGGEAEMAKWINENIQYPQVSAEMGEQGIVYVQFVVKSDGSIDEVKVIRGVSEDLDKEAQRVVKKMPKWSPGEQAGKKVSVRYTLPIHFKLG